MNARHWDGIVALAAAGASAILGVQLAAQGSPGARTPNEITAIRFNAGQSVVPYFEGWIKNGDGSFDMVFGYFNRNYQQEFVIPAGADNRVEPGSADAGQPTYFAPRRQRYIARFRVPADFGKKELVWTITANGRTERGYGNLLPEQEITERVVMTNGNYDPGHDDPNRPPKATFVPPATVVAGKPVTLTAAVTDDGLPKPRPESAPKAPTTDGPFRAQVNSSGQRPRLTTLTWLPYRGPAKVVFDPAGSIPVEQGTVSTTAVFEAAGTYTLVLTATDPGRLSSKQEVQVTVVADSGSRDR